MALIYLFIFSGGSRSTAGFFYIYIFTYLHQLSASFSPNSKTCFWNISYFTYRAVPFSLFVFCFFGEEREEPIKARLEYICHSIYIVGCSSKVREFPVT